MAIGLGVPRAHGVGRKGLERRERDRVEQSGGGWSSCSTRTSLTLRLGLRRGPLRVLFGHFRRRLALSGHLLFGFVLFWLCFGLELLFL